MKMIYSSFSQVIKKSYLQKEYRWLSYLLFLLLLLSEYVLMFIQLASSLKPLSTKFGLELLREQNIAAPENMHLKTQRSVLDENAKIIDFRHYMIKDLPFKGLKCRFVIVFQRQLWHLRHKIKLFERISNVKQQNRNKDKKQFFCEWDQC